jgi:hypothetical protein
MTGLQKYFALCTFCNVIMTMISLIIKGQHILNNRLDNIIIFFALVNILKIINQIIILQSLSNSINNMVNLISDRIFDFVKIVIYIFIIASYESFCINILTTFMFVSFCINFMVIIAQFFSNLIKPNLLLIQFNQVFVANNDVNVANVANITTHQDVYINMPENHIVNYIVDDSTNTCCAICLDEQKINESWSILNCTHEFHDKCIKNWLQRNNTCPTCRYLVN